MFASTTDVVTTSAVARRAQLYAQRASVREAAWAFHRKTHPSSEF